MALVACLNVVELAKSDDEIIYSGAITLIFVLFGHEKWKSIWDQAKDLIYKLNEHLMLNPDDAHASGKSLQDLWRLDQVISHLLIDGLSMDALEQLHRRAWNLDGPMQPAAFLPKRWLFLICINTYFKLLSIVKIAEAPIAIKLSNAEDSHTSTKFDGLHRLSESRR